MENYDFSGWATRNDLVCTDGRTIRKDAFKNQDGQIVPLVWNHNHSDPTNILGHARLENREEGVYAYCSFNDTESGQNAKRLVQHGDVRSLSIMANQLKQSGQNVLHGTIRELSLVLAGANPGAFIDSVMAHGSDEEEGIVLGYDENIMLYHASDDKQADENGEGAKESNSKDDKTIGEIFDSLTEEQKEAMYAIVGELLDSSEDEDNENNSEGDDDMKHNIFDNSDDVTTGSVLIHSDGTAVTFDEVAEIFKDAKRYGSLKDSVLAHGIDQVDYLFPDAQNLTRTPIFIKRDTGWVSKVMNGVHKTPFSRIKSMFADLTEDDARAKGYIKGNMKKEEVFSLLKRSTTPTTVYKKQKMDRDDVIDITDFDVVSWLKSEMRMMLDEEIARAVLVGDGRLASSDDKISEQNIRPIYKDDDLFTIKVQVDISSSATDDDKASAFIRSAIKTRKDYKGSGNPTLYITEDMLTNCLLLTDTIGRDLYTDEAQLARKLRVKEIVTVPVMESMTGSKGGAFIGIIVNLDDYNVGADKGGAVNMFDDFDIDYNAQKYLIETRCSGALTVPYSAMAFEFKVS